MSAFRSYLRGFARDEQGATLVEFGMVICLFLLLFFGLLDFGRLAFHVVASERAMQIASRVAAVRPPACAGVPTTNKRPVDALVTPEFGTSCGAGGAICEDPGTVSCSGDANNATAQEIWSIVRSALPSDATIDELAFSYSYNPKLGFLGGPYVPVVTVELDNVQFDFVTPLGALAEVAGATALPGLGENLTLPSMSVSMPGEDLAQGENG